MSDGAGDLYSINRNTGEASLLADGAFTNNGGLTHDPINGVFWGIDHSGTLCSYDPSNGYSRTNHITGLPNYDGLTYVPQPSISLLLAVSVVLCADCVSTIGVIHGRLPTE
jgi:hypothetical protein